MIFLNPTTYLIIYMGARLKNFKNYQTNKIWLTNLYAPPFSILEIIWFTMKKIYKISPLLIVMLLIAFSIILPSIMPNTTYLEYYGSILGSILGILGAYLVLSKQLKQDKKSFNKTQIDNTFFNLLSLFKEIKNPIPPKIFLRLLGDISSGYKNEAQKNQFDEYKKELLTILNSEKVSRIAENDGLTFYIDRTKKYINKSDFYTFADSLNQFLFFPDKIQEFQRVYDIRNNIRDNPNYSSVNKKAKEKIISEIFSQPYYFQQLANYLRLFHRIVKFVMNSELNISDKKEYLGILRAVLSPNELLVIFYNTFYSKNGIHLKEQLKPKNKYTEFFASSEDIDIFNKNMSTIEDKIDLPFFSYDELIFKDEDLLLIKSLVNPN